MRHCTHINTRVQVNKAHKCKYALTQSDAKHTLNTLKLIQMSENRTRFLYKCEQRQSFLSAQLLFASSPDM